MPTFGNGTITGTYTIGGSYGDICAGPFTMPAGGGFITDINVHAANNGSASTDRLYVWKDNGSGQPGAWLVRGASTFSMGGSYGWQVQNSLAINGAQLSSDGYIPGGTVLWIGIYASTGVLAVKGDAGSGSSALGNTNDGDFIYHALTGGFGYTGAYVTYTPLAAPTVSSATPAVGSAGATTVVAGTNLLHTTGVTINGTAAAFVINSDSQLTVTVPAGASSGLGTLVVTTPAGTASTPFTVGTAAGDDGAAWQGGLLFLGDDGANWQQIGVIIWADDGATWWQVG